MNCLTVGRATRSRFSISPLLAIGGAEPDKLRRMPVQHASILKIRVLRDDCEALFLGMPPNSGIVCTPPVRIDEHGWNLDKGRPGLLPNEETGFRRMTSGSVCRVSGTGCR